MADYELTLITPNAESLTRQTGSTTTNPALLYLMTLGTKQSRDKVGRLLNLLAREFGFSDWRCCQWEKIRQPEILALKTKWEIEGKSPSTINLTLSVLKGVAHQAWSQQLISDHEHAVISAIKGARGSRQPKGRALSTIESSRLIVGCELENSVKGIRDAAILALGIGCGLRRAEIASVKVSQLKTVEKAILVLGKGNKERTVYCSDAVWQRLQKWLVCRANEEAGDWLFCSVTRGDRLRLNHPLTEDAIFKIIRQRAKAFGIEDFAPHDMRRTYATRLFDQGGDLHTVSKAMGHANVSTTQRYDKRGEDIVRRLSQQIPL